MDHSVPVQCSLTSHHLQTALLSLVKTIQLHLPRGTPSCRLRGERGSATQLTEINNLRCGYQQRTAAPCMDRTKARDGEEVRKEKKKDSREKKEEDL